MMQVKFDREADAAYLYLTESKIVDSEEVSPGVIYDFDASDNVVGIEILEVQNRTPEQLRQLNFLFSPEDRKMLREFFSKLENAL